MLWSPDGSGTGIRVDRSAPEFERVAMIADQIQDWGDRGAAGSGAGRTGRGARITRITIR